MFFTVIASPKSEHQVEHQEAMMQGLRTHGIDSCVGMSAAAKTKHVVCWGWRAGKSLRKQGHEVLVMERGYIGDRFAATSLAWNGLNGRGSFAPSKDDGGARFNEFGVLRNWRNGGNYVLIMGQVPGDQSLQGLDLSDWYETSARLAAASYNLPVKFRPHPVAVGKGFKQNPHGTFQDDCTLEEDLRNALIVITYNSNSAVDAILGGVPAVVSDMGSMAVPVGSVLGSLEKPAREKWAYDLAWKQWRMEEIRSGKALSGLLKMAVI